MKKLILLTIIGLALSVSPALAQITFTNTATGTGDNTPTGLLEGYRTSTQCTLVAKGDNAAYNAVSGHLQGDTMFGSSGGDSIIYEAVKVAGDPVVASDVPAIPATATDTTGFGADAAWTAM